MAIKSQFSGSNKFMCTVILICVFILSLTSGLKLNSKGGYDVIIAIQEGSEFKGNTYIESIKGIITTFSAKLFLASRGTFYIQSIDILIPSSWARERINSIDVTSMADAKAQSFQTADLRISDSILWPYVENPNICGRPGEFISFPSNFFDAQHGSYGQTWRALINQWALYRWGVWEEHGYPEDVRFPYFYKESPTAAVWNVTGCSNVPIKGKVLNKYGEPDDCDLNSENRPAAECRFYPSPIGNTAATSLMHFQFLESMSEFCDADTHVRSAPNKQNLFCGYQSVWEVIRETPDFRVVLDPIDNGILPNVQFRTMTTSDKPVLYVLVDKGFSKLPGLINKLTNQIVEIFNANIQDTFASLGTFPNLSADTNLYVEERVGWSTIADSRIEFINAMIDDPSERPEYRDFGLAILESVKLIKRKSPPGGAVLFIIKIGAGKDSFDSLAYEEEIFGAFLHERIKLVVIEVREEAQTPYVNLESLVNRVGGIHEMITPSNIDVPETIPRIIQNIGDLLNGGQIPEISNSVLIYKGPVVPTNHPTTLPYPQFVTIFYPPKIRMLKFSLTVPASVNVLLALEEGTIGLNVPEWDESQDSQRRKTIPADLPITGDRQTMGGFFDFAYICRDEENVCSEVIGQLIVYGELDDTEPESDVVDVNVYTSAVNGVVDFNETGNTDTPFSIFARVSVKGVPVANLTVEAFIRKSGEKISQGWTVVLNDDGLGSPDILENDGIYSATFIPPIDGLFSVTVNVQNRVVVQPTTAGPNPGPGQRLVRIDQTQLECSVNYHCEAISLSALFGTSQDLLTPISIINRDLFVPGKPTKINTLEVLAVPYAGIELQFKSSALVGIGSEKGTTNITYVAYVSRTMEALLGDLTDPDVSKEILVDDISSRPPGSPESYLIPWYDDEIDVVVYVAVQTISGDWESALSNIRSVFINTPTTTVIPTGTTLPSTISTSVETSDSLSTDTFDTTTTLSNSPDPTATTIEVTYSTTENTVSVSEVPESTISTIDPTTSSTIDDSTSDVSKFSTAETDPTKTTPSIPSTVEPELDEDDPFFETTWGIVVIIVIVLVVLTAVGGILYFCKKRQENRDYSNYRWRRSNYSTSGSGNKRSTSIAFDDDNSPVSALSRNTRLTA